MMERFKIAAASAIEAYSRSGGVTLAIHES
jgi:hypothetical protein